MPLFQSYLPPGLSSIHSLSHKAELGFTNLVNPGIFQNLGRNLVHSLRILATVTGNFILQFPDNKRTKEMNEKEGHAAHCMQDFYFYFILFYLCGGL